MPRVDELWAWVIEDTGPDDEGVPAYLDMTARMWLPMIGADRDRVQSLRDQAQAAADAMGKPIRLLRSTALEEVYVLEPNQKPAAVDALTEHVPFTVGERDVCDHPNVVVARVPPAWADNPYPAVLTTTCEDCGKVIRTTDVPGPSEAGRV